jgi:hypothetical protein
MGCDSGSSCGGLSVCGFAVAVGFMWAFGVVVTGLFAMIGYGEPIVGLLASMYLGYAATLKGILIGAVWGFIDGAIGGAIVALVYNFSLKHCPCKCCKDRREKEK